jgi:MYXO-CTERM domain-containing protein
MRCCASVIVATMTIASFASADVFTDATGDMFDPGLSNLDIMSVTVTNSDTHLFFDILVNADLDSTNWGKYCVAIDSAAGGSNSNGWGRPIDWFRDIDSWIGTWADDGGSGVGGQVWTYGSDWSVTGGITGDDSGHSSGHQRFSVALSDLGLSIGDTFAFDVISTGGGSGDSGVDHLSTANAPSTGWGATSYAGTFLNYTVQGSTPAVPGVGAIAALGGLGLVRRRRDR